MKFFSNLLHILLHFFGLFISININLYIIQNKHTLYYFFIDLNSLELILKIWINIIQNKAIEDGFVLVLFIDLRKVFLFFCVVFASQIRKKPDFSSLASTQMLSIHRWKIHTASILLNHSSRNFSNIISMLRQ